ncbi:MAG: hypothetical protein HQL77_06890 [Magnetococcales bacterium]|nr:hypothetical protein [Magnetococcales bacterium]
MSRTFSDNWYRIADLRLSLRPGVAIRLHHYRGEPWYVLHERAHAGFFRVNAVTYRFLMKLHVTRTIGELWRQAVDDAPEETPGQEEVFELVIALYRANLVTIAGGVDENKILERAQHKKKSLWRHVFPSCFFLKFPCGIPTVG